MDQKETSKFLQQFYSARLADTSLIGISTADQEFLIQEIVEACPSFTDPVDESTIDIPYISYDIIRGWRGWNQEGLNAIQKIVSENELNSITDVTTNPVESLVWAEKLPQMSVLFVQNAHRYMKDQGANQSDVIQFVQAVSNLREEFKKDFRALVLLAPEFNFPLELSQDVYLIDKPLPSDSELVQLVEEFNNGVGIELDDEGFRKTLDSLRGLAKYPAEQILAMSKRGSSYDFDGLKERHRQMIESVRGATIWREGQRFKDVGGVTQAKEFFKAYVNGRARPRCIVFIDEIEKAMAGARSDSTGVSQDFHGTTLTRMQDNEWTGSIFYGHPGAAKTALAKAIGNEAEIPTIYMDMGAMKASLLGESEQYLRAFYKMVEAIAGKGRALFIATCNDINPLSPELRRRFGLPTFFFDLPTLEERQIIWKIYLDKYDFQYTSVLGIDHTDWTGAEIERCCKLAWELNTTPDQVAHYVIPVAQSSREEVEKRRKESHDRYLDASRKGKYQMTSQVKLPKKSDRRTMTPQNPMNN